MHTHEQLRMSETWNFIITSGQVALPTISGATLMTAIQSPPTDLMGWLVGPFGALALMAYISYKLWHYAKDQREKNEKLRDQYEQELKNRIEKLEHGD